MVCLPQDWQHFQIQSLVLSCRHLASKRMLICHSFSYLSLIQGCPLSRCPFSLCTDQLDEFIQNQPWNISQYCFWFTQTMYFWLILSWGCKKLWNSHSLRKWARMWEVKRRPTLMGVSGSITFKSDSKKKILFYVGKKFKENLHFIEVSGLSSCHFQMMEKTPLLKLFPFCRFVHFDLSLK